MGTTNRQNEQNKHMANSNPLIYSAMASAISDAGIVGVGKDGQNSHQKFNYRSIDNIRAGINPILAKNGLVITSKVHEIERVQNGRDISVTNQHEFTIYAKDGSFLEYSLVLSNVGKDPSKLAGISSSYAYKTMIIDVLCLPTEGATDLDSRDENGLKTSFMPKIEMNKSEVVWSEAPWSEGLDAVVEWGSKMTGQDGTHIMDETKPDSNGKKGVNYAAEIRKIWAAN